MSPVVFRNKYRLDLNGETYYTRLCLDLLRLAVENNMILVFFRTTSIPVVKNHVVRGQCSCIRQEKGLIMLFLIQSDLLVDNSLFRLKPKSGFLTQSEKGFFRLIFFHREFRLAGPVGELGFFDWIPQLKNSVEKFNTCFLNRSHRSSHHNQTHTHTATRPHAHTRYHTAVSYKALTLACLSLLLRLAASQRGAFLVPLASSVYHTTAAARGIDAMLPTTAAVALATLG